MLVQRSIDRETYDFEKLYRNIMDIHSSIRFVTILDFDGRLMHGGQRDGITNYLKPDFKSESIRHALESWTLRAKFSRSIGEGKYAIAEYEKIKRITIPLGKKYLIYLTTETDASHSMIIKKIHELKEKNALENYEKEHFPAT